MLATHFPSVTLANALKKCQNYNMRHPNKEHEENLSINDHIAMRISSWLSSMWCAYFFALLAFVSFPQVIATGNIILIDSWLAQTFIQLVALSILCAGQKYPSP